jgi:hypothetical protein
MVDQPYAKHWADYAGCKSREVGSGKLERRAEAGEVGRGIVLHWRERARTNAEQA